MNEPHIHLENIWTAVRSAGTAMEKCWRDDKVKTLDTGSPLITTPSLSALAYSTGFYFRLVDTYRYESRSKRFIQDILKFFIPNIFNRMTFISQWNEKNQNCIIIEIFFFIFWYVMLFKKMNLIKNCNLASHVVRGLQLFN